MSQSDLWDTHTLSHAKQHQRQAARTCQNAVRCQEHGYQPTAVQQQQTQTPEHHPPTMSPQGPIQRSVSEKNRTKHRHKSKASACQSETDSERERESTPTHTCSQPAAGGRKLAKTMQHHAHHRSSPNVVSGHKHRHRTDNTFYGASSESELLEDGGDILPIFRKLLTEREPRYRGRSNMVGASCPNISIKCDIVEYL